MERAHREISDVRKLLRLCADIQILGPPNGHAARDDNKSSLHLIFQTDAGKKNTVLFHGQPASGTFGKNQPKEASHKL